MALRLFWCEAGSSWHDDGTAMRYRCAPVMMMRVIQQRAGKLNHHHKLDTKKLKNQKDPPLPDLI